MKLRKREVVAAGRNAPGVLPKGNPIKKKPKPQLRAQPAAVMRSINDICLAESMAWLSRAELDSLPLVGRRFARVLTSHAPLQRAPLRLVPNLHISRAKFGYTAFTFEGSTGIKKHKALFEDAFGEQQVTGNKWVSRVRFYTHADEFMAVLDKYPWLRVRHVHLTLPFSTLAGRTEQLTAEWSAMRRLWDGSRLELYAEMPKGYKRRLADLSRVNITNLMGGCGELIVHSPPEMMPFSMPLDDGNKRLANITLWGERVQLTANGIVGYLFGGGGDSEKERSLHCKSLYYDAAQRLMVEQLVELIQQRISSTPDDAIPPFQLKLTYVSREHAIAFPPWECHTFRHDELVEDEQAPHCALELWNTELVSMFRRGRTVNKMTRYVTARYFKPGRGNKRRQL